MTDIVAKCVNCEHYQTISALSGECRIHPPALLVILDQTWSGWPKVSSEDWCSNFSKKWNET